MSPIQELLIVILFIIALGAMILVPPLFLKDNVIAEENNMHNDPYPPYPVKSLQPILTYIIIALIIIGIVYAICSKHKWKNIWRNKMERAIIIKSYNDQTPLLINEMINKAKTYYNSRQLKIIHFNNPLRIINKYKVTVTVTKIE